MTLLVVDDEADIRDTLAEVFQDAGYTVRVASSAEQALVMMRQAAPKVAIVDHFMPGLTGSELVAQMQLDPVLSKVRVILSSSDPRIAPPGVLILRKPVYLKKMVELVRQLCPDPH